MYIIFCSFVYTRQLAKTSDSGCAQTDPEERAKAGPVGTGLYRKNPLENSRSVHIIYNSGERRRCEEMPV